VRTRRPADFPQRLRATLRAFFSFSRSLVEWKPGSVLFWLARGSRNAQEGPGLRRLAASPFDPHRAYNHRNDSAISRALTSPKVRSAPALRDLGSALDLTNGIHRRGSRISHLVGRKFEEEMRGNSDGAHFPSWLQTRLARRLPPDASGSQPTTPC